MRTGTGGTDEDHSHAVRGGFGSIVRLAELALELVDTRLERGNVAPQLLDDLLGRHCG